MKKLKELRNNLTNSPSEGELINAKDCPSFYYCRHMEPGLCGYKDEKVLVNSDTIKKMLPTLQGKPIFINHQEDRSKPDGYVTKVFWNELDDSAWAEMMLVSDESKAAAESGYAVSNAYVPTDWAGRGLRNNVAYDRAITNGQFTHLALVKDPRYETAQIFTPEAFKTYQDGKRQQLATLRNSKTDGKEPKMKFNIFTRKKEPVAVDAADLSDAVIELTNDKGEVTEMTVAQMVEEIQNAQTAAAAKPAAMDGTTKVKIGDKEMTLSEAVALHNSLKAAEAPVETVVVTAPAATEVTNATEKKPDHFAELANANKVDNTITTTVDIPQNKIQRGKNLYGSGN